MSTPSFRFIGTTDGSTTCDKCGREELRSTVILAVLDADGNSEDVAYYGSTCAARALTTLTGRKHTGPKVLDAARAAQRQRLEEDAEARRLLAHYGLPLSGPASAEQIQAAAVLYAHAHRHANWAGRADWAARVLDMLARRQAHVIVTIAA